MAIGECKFLLLMCLMVCLVSFYFQINFLVQDICVAYLHILAYIQNIYYMIFVVNVLYTILKILTFFCKNTTQKKFVRTNFLNEQTKRIFLVFFLNMMMKITMMMMMMG